MSLTDDIRRLAAEGMATADIARKLGIRYQRAYSVVGTKPSLRLPGDGFAQRTAADKPPLYTEVLKQAGFSTVSHWTLDESGAVRSRVSLPAEIGVYAFAIDGVAMYVGVATMGIAKRLYFYGRPGRSQKTSQRLNEIIRNILSEGLEIEILVAFPPDQIWNGLPIHGCAGLELGLIKQYKLPWNLRSAKD
jgi:hypothetical protein